MKNNLPADYEECGECGYDHEYEPNEAHNAHMEELITRVQNGFLFFGTEEQIRTQLESEGLQKHIIDAAIIKGKRLAEVRLGNKE